MLEHEIQQEERIERERKHYAERDVITLGRHYINHVAAMTREGLHSKADIAAELAHRDKQRDELLAALKGIRNKGCMTGYTKSALAKIANDAIARMEEGK